MARGIWRIAAVHPVLDEMCGLLSAPLAGHTAEAIGRHPGGDPRRWNVRQVVEHLTTTWRMTTVGVEDRMRKGRPLLTRPTLRQRALQIVICNAGYFPRRISAPEFVRPAAEAQPVTGDALIARFRATLEAMDAALAYIETESHIVTAPNQAVLNHGMLGPLSVAQWRRFHRTHARHHVPQIVAALD